MESGNYLAVVEVAEEVRVSPWTVRAWITKGLLKRTKVGGRVLVAKEDLEDFIRRCNEGTPPAAGAMNTAESLAATA